MGVKPYIILITGRESQGREQGGCRCLSRQVRILIGFSAPSPLSLVSRVSRDTLLIQHSEAASRQAPSIGSQASFPNSHFLSLTFCRGLTHAVTARKFKDIFGCSQSLQVLTAASSTVLAHCLACPLAFATPGIISIYLFGCSQSVFVAVLVCDACG